MRIKILKRLFYVLASLGLLTAATPASAASDYCFYSVYKFWNLSCETQVGVPANSSGHFVYYEVSPLATYRVYDHVTYVTLRRGSAGKLGKNETIFGLYGSWYSAIVTGPPTGWAYISNS